MEYLLLAGSMLAGLAGSVITKFLEMRFEQKDLMYHVYNAIMSAVCVVVFLLTGGLPSISLFTVLLGIAFGVVTALQRVFSLKAISIGPFSYTTVIGSLSMIIPALSGAIIWNEELPPIRLLGVALMVVCIICSVDFSKKGEKASGRWLLYTMLSFFCSGAIGVMQKWHQSSDCKDELNAFLIVAFAISFVFSLVRAAMIRKQTAAPAPKLWKHDLTVAVLLLTALSGVFVAVCNKVNLYLSGVIDSAVFFPVVNGGGLALALLASIIVFKERLSAKKWFGIAVGTVAVLVLCLPA